MAGGYLDKYFAWRFDVWGGGPKQWNVCEHPPGAERKVVWPKRGDPPNHSEARARSKAQEMNADWRRYESAMFAKAGDRR